MLKYTVNHRKESEYASFPFSEFYVSPDLSYISGVTHHTTGLINKEEVLIRSPFFDKNILGNLSVTDTKRQGKVGIKITLPINTVSTTMYFDIHSDIDDNAYILVNGKRYTDDKITDAYSNSAYTIESAVACSYVEYDGDISYYFPTDDNNGVFLVNHQIYDAKITDKELKIETYRYIEDGVLNLAGHNFYVDYTKVSNGANVKPIIKYGKYTKKIKPDDLKGTQYTFMKDTDGDVIIKDYEPSAWTRVQKFVIERDENEEIIVDDVLYGGYGHYVTYANEVYYLNDVFRKGYDDDGNVIQTYKGYGVDINNNFYSAQTDFIGEENDVYRFHKDIPFGESSIFVEEVGESLLISDTLQAKTENGKFMILLPTNTGQTIPINSIVTASSDGEIKLTRMVNYLSGETPYVSILNRRYNVIEHISDTVNVNGEEFPLIYDSEDYTSGHTIVNDEKIYLDIEITDEHAWAWQSQKIYYKKSEEDGNLVVNFGKVPHEEQYAYVITEHSGITANNKTYPVDEIVSSISGGTLLTVSFKDILDIDFRVTEYNGANTYLCYPIVDNDEIGAFELDGLQRELTSIVVENKEVFNFSLKNTTFGEEPLYPENGIVSAITTVSPFTLSLAYGLENKISIRRVNRYLSFNFPLINRVGDNLMREDVITNHFVNEIKENSINNIVDMEKDVYYPAFKNGDVYSPISEIRFNLHFRNRDLSNWKVIEDDREFKNDVTYNSKKCNWFITDMRFYKDYFFNNGVDATHRLKLQNSSDLLGLLNFTDNDVKYQASKLAKSFLRLSFYSTNNPQTQVLLSTSTIFLDEGRIFKKRLEYSRMFSLRYRDVLDYEVGDTNIPLYKKILPSTELEIKDPTNPSVYDKYRLSSRITVNDKYSTDTSSEGYYIYMFKEYTKKMREGIIYMRIDFNHAGIGQSIPMTIPRHLDTDTPYYMDDDNDLELLKDGFSLKDIYKQLYIPIYVKYDIESNKYYYYLSENMRENSKMGENNEIMLFNLFEIKFKNSAIDES